MDRQASFFNEMSNTMAQTSSLLADGVDTLVASYADATNFLQQQANNQNNSGQMAIETFMNDMQNVSQSLTSSIQTSTNTLSEEMRVARETLLARRRLNRDDVEEQVNLFRQRHREQIRNQETLEEMQLEQYRRDVMMNRIENREVAEYEMEELNRRLRREERFSQQQIEEEMSRIEGLYDRLENRQSFGENLFQNGGSSDILRDLMLMSGVSDIDSMQDLLTQGTKSNLDLRRELIRVVGNDDSQRYIDDMNQGQEELIKVLGDSKYMNYTDSLQDLIHLVNAGFVYSSDDEESKKLMQDLIKVSGFYKVSYGEELGEENLVNMWKAMNLSGMGDELFGDLFAEFKEMGTVMQFDGKEVMGEFLENYSKISNKHYEDPIHMQKMLESYMKMLAISNDNNMGAFSSSILAMANSNNINQWLDSDSGERLKPLTNAMGGTMTQVYNLANSGDMEEAITLFGLAVSELRDTNGDFFFSNTLKDLDEDLINELKAIEAWKIEDSMNKLLDYDIDNKLDVTMEGVGDKFADGAMELTEKVSNTWSNMSWLRDVEEAFSRLGFGLQDTIYWLFSINTIATSVNGVLGLFGMSLGGANGLLGGLGGLIRTVGGGIIKALPIAGVAWGGVDAYNGYNNSVEWLGEERGSTLTGKIISSASGFLGGNSAGFSDGIGEGLKSAGAGALKGIAIGSIFGPLGMAIGGAVGGVAGAVGGENIAKFVAGIPDAIKGVGTWFGEMFVDIGETFNGWKENVSTKVGELSTSFDNWIGGMKEGFVGWISESWTGMLSLGEDIGGWFLDMGVKVGEWIDDIVGFVLDIPNRIMEQGTEVLGGVGDFVGGAWDSISIGASNFVGGVGDWIGGLFGSHASGLSYVPQDGYPALLHKGEMVIPASQANFIRTLFGQPIMPESTVKGSINSSNSFVNSIPEYASGIDSVGAKNYLGNIGNKALDKLRGTKIYSRLVDYFNTFFDYDGHYGVGGQQLASSDGGGNSRDGVGMPFKGDYRVSSPYGYRDNPFGSGSSEFHNGVDWATPQGTPMLAVNSGIISQSGWQGSGGVGSKTGYGYRLYIDSDDGNRYLYGHLREQGVGDGTRVNKGDIVGYSGNTGSSTGPHLHFSAFDEARKSFDPMRIVGKNNAVINNTTNTSVANNSQDSIDVSTLSDKEFINNIAKGAIESYKTYGALPSLVISQAILESGWGTSALSQEPYNNLFGIKSHGWAGESAKFFSKEYDAGGDRDSYFRVYDSHADSVKDHGKFLNDNARYAETLKATNYKEAIERIGKTGYATDPNYFNKLMDIVEDNQLWKYDDIAQGNQTVTSSSTSALHGLEGENLLSIGIPELPHDEELDNFRFNSDKEYAQRVAKMLDNTITVNAGGSGQSSSNKDVVDAIIWMADKIEKATMGINASTSTNTTNNTYNNQANKRNRNVDSLRSLLNGGV